jgi:hypothetical protein
LSVYPMSPPRRSGCAGMPRPDGAGLPPEKFSNRWGQAGYFRRRAASRRAQGSRRGRAPWPAACRRRTAGPAEVVHAGGRGRGPSGPHSEGRPDPRHASRRGRAVEPRSAGQDRLVHPDHAAASPQRKGDRVFHIACRTTASLRATATRAFLKPLARASRKPHASRREKRAVRVSSVVAAS